MDKLKLYMINGYTKNIGSWEVEHFRNEDDAVKAFENYVDEYEATIDEDDEWYATVDDGYGWFTLTEIEV